MEGQMMTDKLKRTLIFPLLGLMFFSGAVVGQVPVDEDGNPVGSYATEGGSSTFAGAGDADAILDATELEELVGPVALYPDDLLAIVLPASTYPLEIVQAARFLEQLENDSSLKPDEAWDDSIVALLNYPEVVRMMDEEIDWTWRLGEAVISQQNEVIAAVEAFRDRAYAAGNLKTDEYQEVTHEDGIIEIVPVDEHIIHVPYYEPAEVVTYQPRRVYYYYPDPYPVYYYPYSSGYRFHSGYFWGVTTAFSIGWSNHFLHVYHPSYWGHPYYGRYYYGHYYRRPSITIYNNWYVNDSYRTPRYRYRDGDYWRPRTRAGSRQDEPRVRNYHYAPNGSSNSRDFTVTRRDRMRTSDNGRMDLNLRERDERIRNAAVANRQARTSVNDRTGNGNRLSLREDNSRRSATSRESDRVNRNRTPDSSRGIGNRTRTSDPRPDIRFRDRADTTRRQQPDRPAVNRVDTGRRSSSSRTVSSPSSRVAPPARTTRPAVRQNDSNRRSTPPRVRQNNTSRQQAAPPPRSSAPAQRPVTRTPRSSAPASRQRAPAAPRQNTGSSSRGDSGSTRSRRSSSSRQRVRSNNQD